MQKYDDECYTAQEAESYHEYGAADKNSPHNGYIKASAANFLLVFDFHEDDFDEESNTKISPTTISSTNPSSST